jgi:uncharacterized protein (TIGR02996 family)
MESADLIRLEAGFLQALHEEPGDEATWLALSDWLEESGAPDRAELTRLWWRLHTEPDHSPGDPREGRLRRLLRRGVQPCVPTLTNSVGMRLALVPAGSFWMGSPDTEPERHRDEGPLRRVEISRPFYLGVTTVTQGQYRQLTGLAPAYHAATGDGARLVRALATDDFPVEMVSWDQAVEFCARLSALAEERAAGRQYCLPTEAMWEYACREAGASRAPFHFGDGLPANMANHDASACRYGTAARPGRYLERPMPVGRHPPNALGLYDLHGNVWEWCSDWYAEDYYASGPARDPVGPPTGDGRALRGGCWTSYAHDCRCARRYHSREGYRINRCFGFRVALLLGDGG